MSTHILFGFLFELSNCFWKAPAILTPFLSYKGITQAYLLKKSITYNKSLNPSLNLLINCISAQSAPQLLSLDPEQTVLFLKFLIIRLRNFLASCSLNSNGILTPWTTYGLFIKKIIDHRSKPSLISILSRVFSNIKCFIS